MGNFKMNPGWEKELEKAVRPALKDIASDAAASVARITARVPGANHVGPRSSTLDEMCVQPGRLESCASGSGR